MFELGQKAYEKGMYSRAIEFLEGALIIIPGSTLLSGEVIKEAALGFLIIQRLFLHRTLYIFCFFLWQWQWKEKKKLLISLVYLQGNREEEGI